MNIFIKILDKILNNIGYKIYVYRPVKKARKPRKKLYTEEKNKIKYWANQFGYMCLPEVSRFYIDLERNDVKLRVYFSPLTCISTIKHPKKGEKTLARYQLKIKDIEKIMRNPRTHLSKKSNYKNKLFK